MEYLWEINATKMESFFAVFCMPSSACRLSCQKCRSFVFLCLFFLNVALNWNLWRRQLLPHSIIYTLFAFGRPIQSITSLKGGIWIGEGLNNNIGLWVSWQRINDFGPTPYLTSHIVPHEVTRTKVHFTWKLRKQFLELWWLSHDSPVTHNHRGDPMLT